MQAWWDQQWNARPAAPAPKPAPIPPPLTPSRAASLLSALRSTHSALLARLPHLPPLGPRTRRGLGLVALLSSTLLAWAALEYWAVHRRSRGLRHRAQRATLDLEELIALLYAIAPEHLGGCLTNASIRAVERSTSKETVTLFATGGWKFQQHSLTGLPLRDTAAAGASSSDPEERLRYWLATTVGKGTTLNGSLGFLLAMMALEAEDVGGEGAPLKLTFRGRRIKQVGMCSGALYTSIAALHRTAEARNRSAGSTAAALPSAGASALPNCLSCHPVHRIEVVCELGTVSPPLLRGFQRRHWGYTPDVRSEQLGEVCEFGTTAVLDYWRATGSLPTPASPQFENVLWEKREMSVPQGKDHWVWIDVESEESAAEARRAGEAAAAGVTGGRAAQAAASSAAAAASPLRSTSRLHIDTSIFFARGLSAGFRDDAVAPDSSGTGVWASVRAGWTSVSRKLAALSPFSSSSAASPSSAIPAPLFPLSILPRPMLLPDSMVLDSRGLGSRIHTSATGAREVIAHVQSTVLINSDAANPTHTQMRGVLLEALALCGLKNRLLTHKISMHAPKRKLKHAATAQQTHQQHASSYTTSASDSSAASSGATPDSSSSPPSDDDADAVDEDDGAITVDTDAHRHNVEQLD